MKAQEQQNVQSKQMIPGADKSGDGHHDVTADENHNVKQHTQDHDTRGESSVSSDQEDKEWYFVCTISPPRIVT